MVSEGYENYLQECLDYHEKEIVISHIKNHSQSKVMHSPVKISSRPVLSCY